MDRRRGDRVRIVRRLERGQKSLLTPAEDAYGAAIRDYWRGDGGYEVVERDDGWIGYSEGPPAYFARFEDWPPRQREAIGFARGRVLDIGCGAGRHSLHLQERGHDVVGIDNSPSAVQVCRERGLENAFVVPATKISAALGAFDTILMLGNNFGLLGRLARARWLLRRFKSITPPGGRIIAESLDPYNTDDPDHFAYHELNRNRGRMAGQLRLRVRYGRAKTPWFDYLIVSRNEMEGILQGTGWAVSRYIEHGEAAYAAVMERTEGRGP